jgi:hypothetical protein
MALDKELLAGFAMPEAPARMTLLNPANGDAIVHEDTGEEAWIELHPAQSAVGRAIDRRIIDKNLRRRVQRLSMKDLDANVVDKLAHLTQAWSLAYPNGKPIDLVCNPDNAAFVYDGVPWMREQVSNFVNDLGNFLTTPSTNSSTSPSTTSDSTV